MTVDGAQGLAAATGAGTVLTLFWKLAETDPEERLSAAVGLIDILISQQEQHAPPMPLRHLVQEEAFLLDQDQNAALPAAASSDAQETRAERIIDNLCSPDVAYSLRRLIRGLASPRQGARQGFAVALAELISRLSDLTPVGPDVLLTLILRASASTKSVKPSEARELLFARLFGIHALIRSRILFQDDDAGDEDEEHRLSPHRVMPGSNLRVFERTLDILLIDVATRKSWIKQSATWLVLQAINGLLHIESADLSWRDEAIQVLYNRIASAASASRFDVDTLAPIIGLSPVLSADQLKSLLCPPFSSANLVASSNLTALARILKELPPEDEAADAKSSTSWTPDLHLVWDQLLDIYYPSLSSPALPTILRANAAPFSDFIRVLIDDSLFAPTSSAERKSWGFSVVQRILARLSAKTNAAQRIRDIPLLFQPNFMRTWINQLSDSSRILHKAARNTAHALLKALQDSPAPAEDRTFTSLALLTTLLTPPLGLRAFDQVTKTRTIEGILALFDGSGLDRYVSFLESEVLRGTATNHEAGGLGEDEGAGAGVRRKWAIDQLLNVVRFRAPAPVQQQQQQVGKESGSSAVSALRDEKVVLRVLRFFATHGWFEPVGVGTAEVKKAKKAKNDKGGAVVHLEPSIRAMLRSRFLSGLQDLSALTILRVEPDEKKHRVAGVDGQGELWVSKAWAIFRALEGDDAAAQWKAVDVPAEVGEGEDVPDAAEVEVALGAARAKVESVLKTLRQRRAAIKSTSDRTELERLRGLEAVLTGTLLFVLDSRADAPELLEPLADSVLLLLKSGSAKSAKQDGPTPDEAFVDAIIGLLDRPSAFLRGLATQAFGACSDLIGAGGLQLLFESLVPSDTDAMDEEGDENATGGDEDEHSHGHSDDDDDEEDHDDEEEEEVEEEQSDSDTSADSDADMDAEVDPELRSKVLKALQASGIADKDAEGGKGGDGEDDDDSDAESDVTMLDDEQMMKLDDKLASIFRVQLKGKNAAHSDEHKEALAQQNKVLDLLESYATHQTQSPLALRLVSPLLSVIRSADKDSKQVANRAATILRSRLAGGSKGGAAAVSSSSTALEATEVAKFVADLQEVHQAVAELTEPEHVSACISASTLLVRALLTQPSAVDEVVRIHRATLQALFQRRGTKPKANFVRDTFARSPLVAWRLRNDLVEILDASADGEEEKKVRSDYVKQVQPFLHTVLVHSLQIPEIPAKEASAFLLDLNNRILRTLQAASATPDGPPESIPSAHRPKLLRELIKFAQQAGRSAQKLAAAAGVSVGEACNLAGWEGALKTLGESKRLGGQKALVTQVQQVVASLCGSGGSGKKGKEEDGSPSKKRARQDDGEDGPADRSTGQTSATTTKGAEQAKPKKAKANGQAGVVAGPKKDKKSITA